MDLNLKTVVQQEERSVAELKDLPPGLSRLVPLSEDL
jgi:hypothetical protein